MSLDDDAILALHRALVTTRSVSHEEGLIADLVEEKLRKFGVVAERIGDNVVASTGRGPELLYCSHLDTVPPTAAWTRDPFAATREGDRIHGLGANDAKAAVAGMIAAFLAVHEAGGPVRMTLLLAPDEETGGKGVEVSWPQLRASGLAPAGIVVGEPTNLEIARAQKGLMVMELIASGDACHAANAAALGAQNASYALARDLLAIERLDFGIEHELLGRITLQPTKLEGSNARNALPARAAAILDLRTVPGLAADAIAARVRERIAGEAKVLSSRLGPVECPAGASIIAAALAASPRPRVYGSRTMSDMVHFAGWPAIKCGPGQSERSHTPDEFVLASEVLEGARFYTDLAFAFAQVCGGQP